MQISLNKFQFILYFISSFESQKFRKPSKQILKNENDFRVSNLRFFYSNLSFFYNINNIVFASKENIYRKI